MPIRTVQSKQPLPSPGGLGVGRLGPKKSHFNPRPVANHCVRPRAQCVYTAEHVLLRGRTLRKTRHSAEGTGASVCRPMGHINSVATDMRERKSDVEIVDRTLQTQCITNLRMPWLVVICSPYMGTTSTTQEKTSSHASAQAAITMPNDVKHTPLVAVSANGRHWWQVRCGHSADFLHTMYLSSIPIDPSTGIKPPIEPPCRHTGWRMHPCSHRPSGGIVASMWYPYIGQP